MGMPARPMDWTVAMVHELPDDGNRYEVIDGELLVSPAPSYRHQHAIADLYRILWPYARELGLDVLFAPAAVTFSPRREVQPDLLVLPRIGERRATRFEDVGRMVLAVEVLSPSTQRNDRVKKRPVYQQEGVGEYWLVDLDARAVERWRPADDAPEVLGTTLDWQPVAHAAPLRIDLVAYFGEVGAE